MSSIDGLRGFKSVQRMLQALSLLTRSSSTEKSYPDGLSHFIRHLGEDADLDRLIEEIKSKSQERVETQIREARKSIQKESETLALQMMEKLLERRLAS